MTARQENVRDALEVLADEAGVPILAAAALAEVEEWETRLAEITSAYEASVVDQTRLEAAEAERDLLQRALNSMDSHAVRLMGEAVAEADRLKAALEDFANHGTRFDCNPTVVVHHTPEWIASQEWWQNRATEMDAAVRNRARAALAPADRNTT